jgi:uncharacterized protein (DUF488 family)
MDEIKAAELCTIGSGGKSLRQFVSLLRQWNVRELIDVRLHNTSQLAGFSKRDDLEFICEAFGIAYRHVPEFAPTEDMLATYRKAPDWPAYEEAFRALLASREAAGLLRPVVSGKGVTCLLCAEPRPERCHRRLVGEYLQRKNPHLRLAHI